MMTLARWAILALALGLLVSAVVVDRVQAQTRPSNVVYVRDYARADCSTDDTAAINTAFQVMVSQQLANKQAGTLDFGSGCYQTFGTINFIAPGNQAWFGTIRGDGPEATVIQGVCGVTTAKVWNFKYGEFSGLKFSGRCGAGNQGRNTDLNHVGLMLGSDQPQMGTNGGWFHNLTFEHYAVGLSVGDFWTAGSTAEMKFSNIGVSQSHIGVMLAGFNTLDNLFEVLNVAETDIGVYSDTAYTTEFHSGSGSNNGTTFYLANCCETTISEWREEYGGNSQYLIQYGSPARDNSITLIGANTVDTFNPHRAFAEAVHPLANGGSNTSLIVENSMLNGAVGGKKVSIIGSAFTNGRALSMAPASLLVAGSCLADINSGQCSQDLPNQLTGEPAFPAFISRQTASSSPVPVSPTATPVPATAIPSTPTPTRTAVPATNTPVPQQAQSLSARWDSVGALVPTTRSSLASLPIVVTNTGSTTWTNTVRASYWWVDSAGVVVLYGDLNALPRSAAPGSTLTMDVPVVTPIAPGSYRLHLVMMQTPSNWFDAGRDVSVIVT